jgi:Phage tail assembly chaperone protein
MSQYVVVENGQITERYDAIPENWRNISKFVSMTDAERASFGFLPVKQSNVDDNPVRYRVVSNDVQLDGNGQPYVNRVVEQIMSDQQYQEYLFNEALSILRNKRDGLLFASDWTMAQDLVQLKGAEWLSAWSTYRQQLRDLTDTYKNGQTIFDPNNVVFPNIPDL